MRVPRKWWLTAATAVAATGVALSAPGIAQADPPLDVCPSGCTYNTISAAVTAAQAGDTIEVGAGTYTENVVVDKANLTLQGAGPATTTITAPVGTGGSTVRIAAANVTVSGFTLTRDGNNPAEWDNNLALSAVSIQTVGGATVTGNVIAGNRTGVDVNNSSGNTITANRITDNRTGLIFRNVTDNQTVTNNWITDNWTVGVLFLDQSSGTNSPEQRALGSNFTKNNISGNWYAQIVDRQAGGSLPAPGTTNVKDFAANWLGSTAPVYSTADTAEPGYSALIPPQFGGSAEPPADAPDIAGPGAANFDVTPLLGSSASSSPLAFTPDYSALVVPPYGAQIGSTPRIQDAVNQATAGGSVSVMAGTYDLTAPVLINKALTLEGPNAGISPNVPGSTAANPARGPEATLAVTGSTSAVRIGAGDVTVEGLRFTATGAAAADVQMPVIGAGVNFGGAAPGVAIVGNVFDEIQRTAVYFNGPTAMDGGSVDDNRVTNPTRPATGCAGVVAPSNCGHQLFNLWKTDNLSFSDNVVLANPGNGDRVRVLNVNSGVGVTIDGNIIRNSCTYSCLTIAQDTDAVQITDNDISVDVGNAVQLHPEFTGGSVTVTGNVLSDPNDYAVVVDGASADLSQVSVTRNALTGGAIRNAAATPLQATCNYYGQVSGPQAAQIVGPATTTPYLSTPDLNGPCPFVVPIIPPATTTEPSTSQPPADTSAPSQSPSTDAGPAPTDRPTSAQIAQTRTEARDELGAPVKQDQAFDFGGEAFVFVPRAGKGRSNDTPVVSGRTATFNRSSLAADKPQKLLAIGCPAVDCTATVELTFTYKDDRGRTRTVKVKASPQQIAAGDVSLVTLDLPDSVRRQILKGKNVRLTITVGLKAGDRDLGTSSRTLTLKTQKPKKGRK